MSLTVHAAPHGPGTPARWTSSAKTGIGTALSETSRVWFTLSHGIFNEIYYPSIDQACVRDMGLIVTDGRTFFSEEKRDADSPCMVWRVNHKLRAMPSGKTPRIETLVPAVIHWSADDWRNVQDATTHDVGLGIHFADCATSALPEGRRVSFTFYWPNADRWEGTRAGTLWLYGVIAIGAWVVCYLQVPENKGKTLEQIEEHWRGGRPARAL